MQGAEPRRRGRSALALAPQSPPPCPAPCRLAPPRCTRGLTAEPGSHLGPVRVRLSSSPRDWRLRQPGPAPAGCR